MNHFPLPQGSQGSVLAPYIHRSWYRLWNVPGQVVGVWVWLLPVLIRSDPFRSVPTVALRLMVYGPVALTWFQYDSNMIPIWFQYDSNNSIMIPIDSLIRLDLAAAWLTASWCNSDDESRSPTVLTLLLLWWREDWHVVCLKLGSPANPQNTMLYHRCLRCLSLFLIILPKQHGNFG